VKFAPAKACTRKTCSLASTRQRLQKLAPAKPPPLQTKYLAHVLKKIVNCRGIFEKFLT